MSEQSSEGKIGAFLLGFLLGVIVCLGAGGAFFVVQSRGSLVAEMEARRAEEAMVAALEAERRAVMERERAVKAEEAVQAVVKEMEAKKIAMELSEHADVYKLSETEYPANLEALTKPRPSGRGPMLPPKKIRDPWGKVYQIDPAGPRNNGLKADIFTKSPSGKIIGNFEEK